MNCQELARWIGPLLDGELDARNTAEVQAHLGTCPACQRRYEAQRALSANMRRLDLAYAAPASLRQRIGAALEAEMSGGARVLGEAAPGVRARSERVSGGLAASERASGELAPGGLSRNERASGELALGGLPRSEQASGELASGGLPRSAQASSELAKGGPAPSKLARSEGNVLGDGKARRAGWGASRLSQWLMWAGWPVAVAASALLATVMLQQRALQTDDIVAAHVRSLLVDHLSDVASTSHHTVKPWFAGKIDFSPPVPDLSSRGFELVGGRLDYVRGQPVAAVIYRKHGHIINVLAGLPGHGLDKLPQSEHVQGYSLRTWRQAGLDLVAISDIDPRELANLVEGYEAPPPQTSD